MKSSAAPATIDEYIAPFPAPVRASLRELRRTIRSAAPEATEKISYRIPTFVWEGRPLIYFAGFKSHIGFYPVPRQHPDFSEALAEYEGGKGTARFPLDRPLPTKLIRRIVKFRMQSNRKAAKVKASKKKAPAASKRRASAS